MGRKLTTGLQSGRIRRKIEASPQESRLHIDVLVLRINE